MDNLPGYCVTIKAHGDLELTISTAATMAYCEITGDVGSGLGKKGGGRLSCVTVVTFRKATWPRPTGWVGLQPGGNLGRFLCKVNATTRELPERLSQHGPPLN